MHPQETRQVVKARSLALLKELRLAADHGQGYSLRDMADRLPCSKSTLAAFEKGELPTISAVLAERIAEVLRVEPTVLFAPTVPTRRGRRPSSQDVAA